MSHIRFAAAACQTDQPNPLCGSARHAVEHRSHPEHDRDSAVAGSAPFLPVRLVVFPEFAHSAPIFPTVSELLLKLITVPIPQRAHRTADGESTRARPLHPEPDPCSKKIPDGPGVVFNTTCLIGPSGIALQLPQSQSMDPVRGPRQPARSRRLRRAALPGRRHADRADRLCHLLRLGFLSRSLASVDRKWRRVVDSGLRLYGSVGRD